MENANTNLATGSSIHHLGRSIANAGNLFGFFRGTQPRIMPDSRVIYSGACFKSRFKYLVEIGKVHEVTSNFSYNDTLPNECPNQAYDKQFSSSI